MAIETIKVEDLRLDGENPRHDPTKGEQKVIAALMADFGPQITALAKDIAANGLSPIDPPMVVKDGKTYTMIEGNRRLTAVRLLANPRLAPRPADVTAFTDLAKIAAAPITVISCYVAPSREEARHWQELRHRGQAGGRGVIPWDPEAINRFFGATSNTTAKAILLADAIKAAYPLNTHMLADLDEVMKKNSSTLGRLMSDPTFREGLGIVLKPAFGSHFSSSELEPVLMRVLADLTGPNKKRVADFYYQTQREDYVRGLAAILPGHAQRQAHATALVPLATPPPPLPTLPVLGTTAPVVAPSVPGSPTTSTTPTGPSAGPPPVTPRTRAATIVIKPPSPPTPQALFASVKLTKLGTRVPLILWELQQLDLNNSPNAAAVLMRAVVELAVSQVF